MGFEIQLQSSKLNSMKVFLINMLFFHLELCAYIYLFYTFSVLQDNVAIFLIIWTYYLQQQYELTKWCKDITYNLCASFWVQILHGLLLNPQHFSKYFDTVYNNFHLFIDLTVYLSTWRIWWALNNGSKGQMEFNTAFKGCIYYDMILQNNRCSWNNGATLQV